MLGVSDVINQYFRLSISKKIVRPLEIIGLPEWYKNDIGKDQFTLLDDAIVAYFKGESLPEISAVLASPAFLICDELKELCRLYYANLQAKAIQIFAGELEHKENYLYWIPRIEPVTCIHSTTEKYSNGMVKHLVLDKELVKEYPIFLVDGILEHWVIVTLPLAESILRRCLYGIQLDPVEVK